VFYLIHFSTSQRSSERAFSDRKKFLIEKNRKTCKNIELGFGKIKNVKLHADNYALDRPKASPLHSGQVIRPDGTVLIPAVSKEVLFPFILSQEATSNCLNPAN
jgi:hypothetical protein